MHSAARDAAVSRVVERPVFQVHVPHLTFEKARTCVSTQDMPQPTSQTPVSTATSDVEEFFRLVAAAGYQPRLRTVNGVCQFDIQGMGTWRVTLKDGVPTVTRGGDDMVPPTCTVTATAEDFDHLLRQDNHLNAMAALLQGLISVSGDLAFAQEAIGNFMLEPIGAHP